MMREKVATWIGVGRTQRGLVWEDVAAETDVGKGCNVDWGRKGLVGNNNTDESNPGPVYAFFTLGLYLLSRRSDFTLPKMPKIIHN